MNRYIAKGKPASPFETAKRLGMSDRAAKRAVAFAKRLVEEALLTLGDRRRRDRPVRETGLRELIDGR